MTNHRKPSNQLPFTLNRPIVGRSLPFAFPLGKTSIPVRGVYELSKTGTHTQITIHIRLSNKHGLGLANLGEIWQINDELNGNLSPFKGVVTAIQIDVKSEKGVPQIWQVVTLDRYDDV